MLMVTFALFSALGCNKIETWIKYGVCLADQMQVYEINTPERIACFLSHVWVETAGMTKFEEDLWYTSPNRLLKVFHSKFGASLSLANQYIKNPEKLANFVYSNRNGNGNESSGDGWKFRGRGLFQHTFKDNYDRIGQVIGLDLVSNPDWLLEPYVSIKATCLYWDRGGYNKLVDAGEYDFIQKAIVGSNQGKEEREDVRNKILKFFRDIILKGES